jgi:energy-coupling factor transporter transmembrane protein EcfT
MEARGYVVGEKRTNIDELKFKLNDVLSFAVVLGLLAMSIVLMVTHAN